MLREPHSLLASENIAAGCIRLCPAPNTSQGHCGASLFSASKTDPQIYHFCRISWERKGTDYKQLDF